MQITNNTQPTSYNETSNANTRETTNSGISFQELLESNENQETSESSSVDLGVYTKYAASYNLTQEEAQTFKNILEDEKLTVEELNNLPYEQVEKIAGILNDRLQAGEDNSLVSYIKTFGGDQQVADMINAATLTKDNSFNQSLYTAMGKTSDFIERSNIFSQVRSDLAKTFTSDDNYIQWLVEERTNGNTDLSNFFEKMFQKHSENLENALKNPNILQEAIKQYEEKVEQYNNLSTIYSNILNASGDNSFYA
ncbi:hypothetical protein [Halarcobacter anaerophilus]|uniref:Uncharacterized protein n=1 Tax=Halarcobacter anaerophilus TaxID=877500 RepID=A0A4Q0XZX9_9BACT|nr:hypothetical protein [Halarcobacter anaerophilus]QDF28559.1 hypothetical protein AANAER_1073 [Halarcobacter anaerophilus]RXJ63286.1 hypothetical protein CRV06_06305 [Halarcobacter anaerophilus]